MEGREEEREEEEEADMNREKRGDTISDLSKSQSFP